MISHMKDKLPVDMKLPEIPLGDMCARYSAAAAVFGILFTWLDYPEGIYIGFVLAVAAVSLGRFAKKSGSAKGSATFGIVFGIIGAIFCAFLYFGMSSFYNLIRDPETGKEAFTLMEQLLSSYGLSVQNFAELMNP